MKLNARMQQLAVKVDEDFLMPRNSMGETIEDQLNDDVDKMISDRNMRERVQQKSMSDVL